MVQINRVNISVKSAKCPYCGAPAKRHSIGRRRLTDIGISGPRAMEVTYSKHFCEKCRKHFSQSMDHLAHPAGKFTNRVRHTAINLVLSQALTLEKATQRMREKYHVSVSPAKLHDWVIEELTGFC